MEETITLSPPVSRRSVHLRRVHCEGFRREDGHFDIEGRLLDTRGMALPMQGSDATRPAGAPVHGMALRLRIDNDMLIHAVETAMPHTPFDMCPEAAPAFQALVGERVDKRWRATVNEHVGGVRGCTHLKELLLALGTVAFQTVGAWRRSHERLDRSAETQPPHFLHGCRTWALDGPVVARLYPQFARPKPDEPVAESPPSDPLTSWQRDRT